MKAEISDISFPKKAIFFKMSDAIIQQRQQALQSNHYFIYERYDILDFMNALCNCSHDVTLLLMNNVGFCSFIELKESTKALIVKSYLQ